MSQRPVHLQVTHDTNAPAKPGSRLRKQVLMQFGIASAVVLTAALCLQRLASDLLPASPATGIAVTMIGLWMLIAIVAWRGLAWHQHEQFGAANTVTMLRATGTALLAGLVPVADKLVQTDVSHLVWPASLLAACLLLLDGVDGYLARLTGLVSAFGARFDMEIDSLLALVLSVVLWQSGEVGIWILGLGVMRYLFVLTSFWSAPLRGNLYPSMRRKLICVIQLATLCAILSPIIEPPLSQVIGLLTLICLAASFAHDIRWLYQHHS